MHRPDVWLQTTPVILDQRKRLASKGRPCMEDACSRMECGKDAICRGVRRSVRGQSLNQLGSAHKISDSPANGEGIYRHETVRTRSRTKDPRNRTCAIEILIERCATWMLTELAQTVWQPNAQWPVWGNTSVGTRPTG